MQSWDGPQSLAAAEEAYVAAEMDRLHLIFRRRLMIKADYQEALIAAWSRADEALNCLSAIRSAEAVRRLTEAAEAAERTKA